MLEPDIPTDNTPLSALEFKPFGSPFCPEDAEHEIGEAGTSFFGFDSADCTTGMDVREQPPTVAVLDSALVILIGESRKGFKASGSTDSVEL